MAGLSREWDLRFTLPTATWKHAVKSIQKQLKQLDHDQNLVDFAMLSGVEFGTLGRNPDKLYHVHAGVITSEPVSSAQAKAVFLGDERPSATSAICIDSYSKARDVAKPYRGWLVHHAKLKFKVDPSTPMLYRCGRLPADEPTQLNADKIMAVTREYAPERLARERKHIEAWGIPIEFKRFRLPKTPEERRTAKQEYLRLYHLNPAVRDRTAKRNQARKIQQFMDNRETWLGMDKTSEKAPAVYCQLQVLQSLPYVKASMDENGIEPIPKHDFNA